MKAAVLHQLGSPPPYQTFSHPVSRQDDQLVMSVKAASLKNLDKARASGKHYASHTDLPTVVGIDGVGQLSDGTRVYAQGLTGMMAEKALIAKNRYTVLPDGLDDVLAAALPNAVMGAALALRYRGRVKAGDVVLINGATGVTGQLAVQLARYYGASRVMATGRNPESLDKLKTLGADDILSLRQTDEALVSQISERHRSTPIHVVIDYLWGHPVELVIEALKSGGPTAATQAVRIVTVGSMAGEEIKLASAALRSSTLELVGSGLGSFSPDVLREFSTDVLPAMFQLAAEGKLSLDTETVPLSQIATAWQQEIAPGRRLVVQM